MGVMNLLPWGGPVARAATVLGVDATGLWLKLIPIQIFGIVATVTLAVILGSIEKKRRAGTTLKVDSSVVKKTKEKLDSRFKKLLPLNIILTIAVIGLLMVDVLQSYYVFMLYWSISFFALTYPNLNQHKLKRF